MPIPSIGRWYRNDTTTSDAERQQWCLTKGRPASNVYLMMRFWSTDDGLIHELEDHQIFVFGSNRQGIHGAGAAKTARDKFGAVSGSPSGLQGQSYAIPTVDFNDRFGLASLFSEWLIFLADVTDHPDLEFWVTAIGTGLAGFTTEEVCQMVRRLDFVTPENVLLPPEWEEHLA